jgi:hypothetical protein
MSQHPIPEQSAETPMLVQREVGRALRLSFESVTREPLSEQIVLLLLRMALAEALRVAVEEDERQNMVVDARARFSVSL